MKRQGLAVSGLAAKTRGRTSVSGKVGDQRPCEGGVSGKADLLLDNNQYVPSRRPLEELLLLSELALAGVGPKVLNGFSIVGREGVFSECQLNSKVSREGDEQRGSAKGSGVVEC